MQALLDLDGTVADYDKAFHRDLLSIASDEEIEKIEWILAMIILHGFPPEGI